MANLKVEQQLNQTCKISVLCDNHSLNEKLGEEWGLSMALELPENELWLWDCAATSLFLKMQKKWVYSPKKPKVWPSVMVTGIIPEAWMT